MTIDQVRFVGHATVEISQRGTRLLTDPFLRNRLGPLVRRPALGSGAVDPPDAVLISHLHGDHFDLPTLRRLGRDTHMIVPRGAGHFARAKGFTSVTELAVGETEDVGTLAITAVPANHDGHRTPWSQKAETIGYVVSGESRVYFAGDTDLFDGMADLAGGLDLALLPVWGWGPTIGSGHLDPRRAAEALRILKPRVAVPIHWGTLYPRGLRWLRPWQLTNPPLEFARVADELAPEVDVRVLEPGESTSLSPVDLAGSRL